MKHPEHPAIPATPIQVAARAMGKVRAAAQAPGNPVEAILFEDRDRPYCVGGAACLERCADPAAGCEARNVYAVKLEHRARIARIQLYARDTLDKAHWRDTLDQTRWADLIVRVDGAKIGKVSAFGQGSMRGVAVNRTGQLITVETAARLAGPRAVPVEAVISDLYVFGHTIP